MKTSNAVALILMLLAYPIITVGVNIGAAWLWWAGLLSLTVGALVPPVEKFMPKKEES